MRNPDRFNRILDAIGDVNAKGFDRVRHAESVYVMCEDSTLSATSGNPEGMDPSLTLGSEDSA